MDLRVETREVGTFLIGSFEDGEGRLRRRVVSAVSEGRVLSWTSVVVLSQVSRNVTVVSVSTSSESLGLELKKKKEDNEA